MNEVNQLIQQAFMMGQQSLYQQPGKSNIIKIYHIMNMK